MSWMRAAVRARFESEPNRNTLTNQVAQGCAPVNRSSLPDSDEYVEMDGNFLPKRRQITSTRNGRTQNLDILLEAIELLEELKLTSSTE